MTLYRDADNLPTVEQGKARLMWVAPVEESVYRFGKGAYGIRTFEQALEYLAVAENGGDVEEVLAALRTMVEIGVDDDAV